MTCQWLDRGTKGSGTWHRLWCAECRGTQAVDATLARGVAQLRDEPAPPEGLKLTLVALGLRDPEERRAEPRVSRRSAPVVKRRMVMAAAVGVAGVYLAAAFLGRSQMAALAGTIAALDKVASYHWSGVWVSRGQPLHWETWYAAGKRREDLGQKTTVDDGHQQRSHKAGAAVVFVDRSHLAEGSGNGSVFQPGGFLRRIEEMSRRPGWFVRIEKAEERTTQGRALERFEISMTMDQRVHPSHNQRSKLTLLVNPSTKLPIRWTMYRWQEGRWRLQQRVDQVDYNVAIPARVFHLELPAGARTVDVDWSKRAHARLAAQTTPEGKEVVIRAIDLTAEGDVMVSITPDKPGHDMTPPTPMVMELQAIDEQGRVYVDADSSYIAATYEMRWLVPLVPRQPRAPWPRRFTITAELTDRERINFHDVPASPPAYESVREMPPYHDSVMDAQDIQQTQARARAQYRIQNRLRR